MPQATEARPALDKAQNVIEFYSCLSSPQLRCNSSTGPAAVSAGSILSGFVDARLIPRFNADLYTPCNAHWDCSESQHFYFVENSVNGLAAVAAGNISCGVVNARLIARFNADL